MYCTKRLTHGCNYQNKTTMYIGLGLEQKKSKKRGLPSQSGRGRTGKYLDSAWAEAHTSRDYPLCGQGRRAMEDPHGPHTRVFEGACAIKVSMSCHLVCPFLIYLSSSRTDQQSQVAKKGNQQSGMWHTGPLESRQ